MGNPTVPFKELRRRKKHRHKQWKKENTKAILESGLKFETKEGSFLFRESGKPSVDFFPGTGRWRSNPQDGKMYSGGASSFLKWYKRQTAIDCEVIDEN